MVQPAGNPQLYLQIQPQVPPPALNLQIQPQLPPNPYWPPGQPPAPIYPQQPYNPPPVQQPYRPQVNWRGRIYYVDIVRVNENGTEEYVNLSPAELGVLLPNLQQSLMQLDQPQHNLNPALIQQIHFLWKGQQNNGRTEYKLEKTSYVFNQQQIRQVGPKIGGNEIQAIDNFFSTKFTPRAAA